MLIRTYSFFLEMLTQHFINFGECFLQFCRHFEYLSQICATISRSLDILSTLYIYYNLFISLYSDKLFAQSNQKVILIKENRLILQILFKMQQTPQNQKQRKSNQTGDQIFFQTAQDHNINSQQSLNGNKQKNKKPITDLRNISPFNFNNQNEASLSQIQSNNRSHLSRDPENQSKIDQRMRNKYMNNIMGNTIGFKLENNYPTKEIPNLNKHIIQDRNYKTLQHGPQIQKKLLDFADPMGYQDYILGKQAIQSSKNELQSKILIQKTLLKPKFSFKQSDNSQNRDQTTNSENDLISFDTSSFTDSKRNQDEMSLSKSKSASNFGDILKIEDDRVNMRIVKNGNIEGYLMNKVDKKQQKIVKKLNEIKKNNEIYDMKIKQKQKEIQTTRNKIEKQQRDLHNYQSKMMKAYDNVVSDTSSLMLNSRNYQQSNPLMDRRVEGKTRIHCNFEGMPKKLCKQILYGKCLLLQNQLLQIGFDNKNKPGLMQIYFTIKQNLIQMQAYLEDVNENGYSLEQDFQMKVNNIPAGKKIKTKINVKYKGTKGNIGFIKLKVIMKMKMNINSIFTQTVILPFVLYRNFFSESSSSEKNEKTKKQHEQAIEFKYKIVTQWENSCQQLIKNARNYIDTLFNLKTGKWVQQNIYHINLRIKDVQQKPVNILINNKNFAIEMADSNNLDVVACLGNLLARCKDNKESKISRFM